MTLTTARPGPAGPAARLAAGDDEPRRSTTTLRSSDYFALTGALVAGLSLTALLFAALAPLDGRFGFVVVTYVLFLGVYTLLVSFDESGATVRDRVAAVVVHSVAAVLFGALAAVIVYTVYRGATALPNLAFFTEDLSNTGPLDPIEVGGVLHALLGTLIMISIALAVVIPLGITCALFLNELPGRFARVVRTITEAMTALPSIVAGLFIYATLIQALGFEKSGFAAAMAISVMMLPIIIRAADVVLRLVPRHLKEASLALGAGQWRTIWHVTLPTARSGLATAVILGTARGIGETSPVLLTAGYTAAFNVNPLSGPMVSLPLATFELVKSPQPTMIARGFGTAALLLTLVLLLFVLGRFVGGRGPGLLTARQRRRRVAGSVRDAERFGRREQAREVALLSGSAHVPDDPPGGPPLDTWRST